MKTLHACTCDFCGAQFHARLSSSHVCAQTSCRRAYKRAVEKKYVASMSEERRARLLERKRLYEKGRRRYEFKLRACAMCGKEFAPRNSLHANCSRVCAERSHHAKADARDERLMAFRASRERTCAVCGAAFTARVNRQRTCSGNCSYQLRLNRQSDQRKKISELRRAARDRQCAHCGKQFQSKTLKQITCSVKCRKSHRRGLQPDQRVSSRNHFRSHSCRICGAAFTGASNAKFCSDACRRVNHNRTYGAGLVDHPEKQCVQCGRSFKTNQRHQLTCTKECARLRQLAIKSRLHKEAYARNAATRAAIREERERQRALRAPVKRKNAFTISPTLTCPGCGGQVKRDTAVCGCCSTTCVEAAQQRTRVRTLGDSVAVDERVLVVHFAIANIGGVDRMIQTSDAGIITRIIDDVAEILYVGKHLHHPVALIETTKSIPQIVREKMEAHMSPRKKQIAFRNRNPIEAL